MFVYNVKISSAKKLVSILAAASIAAAVICIVCMISVQSKVTDTATCDEIGIYALDAKTPDEQAEFLGRFNLLPDRDSMQSRMVVIPCEFDDVYSEYNEIQKAIGLDLSRFKGKKVCEITYNLNKSKFKYAVLLVYKDKVIGAHLTDGEYGSKNVPLTQ